MTDHLTHRRDFVLSEMIGHAYREGFTDFLRDMDGASESRMWEAASSGTPDAELSQYFKQRAVQSRAY